VALQHHARRNKAVLVVAGLDWSIVEGLTGKLAFFEEVQLLFQKGKASHAQKQQDWVMLRNVVKALHKKLITTYRFAFRHSPKALESLKSVSRGQRNLLLAIDFGILCAMGDANLSLLEAINFNFELLDKVKR